VVRGLALGLINKDNARRLITKELGIALLNGSVWGSIMGVATYGLYRNVALGGVMAAAMTLNLLVTAVAGYLALATIDRMGRDPAFGSAVLLTFITDSIRYLILAAEMLNKTSQTISVSSAPSRACTGVELKISNIFG
jgi:magnesium transporter